MTELHIETDINSTAESVFAALTDLPGYDRWLPKSSAFPGTTEVSSDPVAVGTTYTESAAAGVRRGTITELQPPTLVTFHQPMVMKPALLGTIDIHVRYTLTKADGLVHLSRVVELTLPWQLKLMKALVLKQFRVESERTVQALKAFLEKAE